MLLLLLLVLFLSLSFSIIDNTVYGVLLYTPLDAQAIWLSDSRIELWKKQNVHKNQQRKNAVVAQ